MTLLGRCLLLSLAPLVISACNPRPLPPNVTPPQAVEAAPAP